MKRGAALVTLVHNVPYIIKDLIKSSISPFPL